MVKFYFLLDLVRDLYEIVEKDKNNIVIMTYDDLVLKIYRKNKGEVALTTIIRKLQQLEKAKIIKVSQKRYAEYGVVYSDKAKVVIYKPLLRQMLPEKTIAIKNKSILSFF